MSRTLLGFVAVHAVLIAPGAALLWALGIVERLRDLPRALGPAYIAGVALVIPTLIALLTLGWPAKLPQFVLVAAAFTTAFAVAGTLAGRRGRRVADAVADEASEGRGERWGWWLGIAAIALFFVVGLSAFAKLPTGGDDATIWTFKALALFQLDSGLDNRIFESRTGAAHPYYPILQPVLESTFFRAAGGAKTMEWHMALWTLYAAFVWTFGFLLRRRGAGRLVVLAPVAALALAPAAARGLSTGYADITVACLAGLGALCIGLWVEGAPGRYALLGGLFLGAAANTKNEGQLAALAIVTAMGVVVVAARGRGWRPLLGTAALVAASVLPWVLWRSAQGHTPHDNAALSDALSPSYLADTSGRLEATLGAVFPEFASLGNWLWIAPAFLALAIVCIAAGTLRRVAAFYLGAATLMLLGLVWIYWTGLLEIQSWLQVSVGRTVTGIILVGAAGAAHLATRLATQPEPAGDAR